MSNYNNKSTTTKLKGTEMLARHEQYLSRSSSILQSDFATSDSSHASDQPKQSTVWSHSMPKLISESQQPKCGGRGLAVERLAQSISKTPKNRMENSNMIYSNKNIESYFENLKVENAKKLKEENEKMWGNLIHTNKSS